MRGQRYTAPSDIYIRQLAIQIFNRALSFQTDVCLYAEHNQKVLFTCMHVALYTKKMSNKTKVQS